MDVFSPRRPGDVQMLEYCRGRRMVTGETKLKKFCCTVPQGQVRRLDYGEQNQASEESPEDSSIPVHDAPQQQERDRASGLTRGRVYRKLAFSERT
uniref:Uncharacterized protein n=1 Tax=Knipowitschia caucasica TaxID=637954 RepID=A0AAV2JTS9_KNICA